MLEDLSVFVISLIIGLLIGLEREHSHAKGTQAMGVRTFVLFALLGTIAATLNNSILSITISSFVFLAILLAYFSTFAPRVKNPDIGVTTEISAAIVFCLGFMVPTTPLLAAVLGGIVLLVLLERKRLHLFARKKLKTHEVESAVILFIFILGVLPFLPNQTIDPWHIFNPRKFGILMAMIAGIQFGGYASVRLFGNQLGMAMMGILGGFVSSTVVFMSLANMLQVHPKLMRSTMAMALLSIVAMLIEILMILLVASLQLFLYMLLPILVMLLLGLVSAFFLLYTEKICRHEFSQLANPLHILPILKLTLFIGGMIIIVSLAKYYLGTEGILLISFLGGLFEIHSITLATTLLYVSNQLQLSNVGLILAAAIFASFVSKFFLLWVFCPRRFAIWTSVYISAMLVSGALTFLCVV